MLPILETLLRASMESKQKIEEIDREFLEVQENVFLNGGMKLNIKLWGRRKAEREKALQVAKDSIAEINATGVQVKDLDMGLLDFPCKVDTGEIVLLCWKLGETAITHWHGMEEGYAGRKPIDDRIARAEPDQIN